MYKSDLKDIVAGDIVILRNYDVEFSLVPVISITDDEIILNDNRVFTKEGTGITYQTEYICAPLEQLPGSRLTALQFYLNEQEYLVRRELITRLRKFDFAPISTATIENALYLLISEVSKHA